MKFGKPYKMWVALPWAPYVMSIDVVRHSAKQCWRVPERGGAPYVMKRFERIYDKDLCTVFEMKLEAIVAAVGITKVYLDLHQRDFKVHLDHYHAAGALLTAAVTGLTARVMKKRGRHAARRMPLHRKR